MKREIIDRLHVLDEQIRTLEDERAVLRELVAEWPDGEGTLAALVDDDDLPDTLPGTPRTKSSSEMAAVRDPTKP